MKERKGGKRDGERERGKGRMRIGREKVCVRKGGQETTYFHFILV